MKIIPVCRVMCVTCPFRAGSPYAHLAGTLAESAMTESSRICHSTGSGNAINRRTGKPARLCRGARDIQLRFFAGLGVIAEPTDAAWAAKIREIEGGGAVKRKCKKVLTPGPGHLKTYSPDGTASNGTAGRKRK